MRAREEGYCLVTDERGGQWTLPRSEHARVLTAWQKGCRWVETFGFHGDPLCIRFKGVDSIRDISAEVAEAMRAEERADNKDDSLNNR